MKETHLNKQQKEVVDHTKGELLVVAGAGTGKTKTIVERIGSLIENGVNSSNILALTFTEKAAQEMLDRAGERLQIGYGAELAIHTFNAFGQLLIEEFAVEVGLSNRQKLVGEDGRIVFMRERIDYFELEYFAPSSRPDSQLVLLANYFSQLKQLLVTPKKYLAYAESLGVLDEADELEQKKHLELASAYSVYIKLMREANIIDYDDQIYLAVEILEQRPNIRKKLQQRYLHIMVDEFQDTNLMQSRLIDLIYSDQHNDGRSLVVVGDDDQAIYEWRGATLANILEFSRRYPDTKKIALTTNYRTTQEILDSAWKLIQHNNPNRLESIEKLNKKLVADKGPGHAPQVIEFEKQYMELSYVADAVADHISIAKKEKREASIAILTRSRRLAKMMHDVLETKSIEHVVAGLGEDLYEQPVIRMMIDALSAVWQPKQADAAMYHTLLSDLFKCDPVIVSESAHNGKTKHIPLADILYENSDSKIQSALNKLIDWHKQIGAISVRELSYKIIDESGLKDELFKKATEDAYAEKQVMLLGQWFEALRDFESITTTSSLFSYLENLPAIKAEGEIVDDTVDILNGTPVVMTIHKSKGLEWDDVYVIGVNERSFPNLTGGSSLKIPEELRSSPEADSRIYEERRLMYVAATRAKKNLVITHSKKTEGGKIDRKPSRFIEELELKSDVVNFDDSFEMQIPPSTTEFVINTISLPRKLVDGDNIILSASQAEDYIACPRNFYYKHVLGVPELSGPEAKVGSIIHDVIQQINEAKQNGTQIPDKKLILKKIENEWPEHGYVSRKQHDTKVREALRALDTLYDRLVEEPVPLEVEKPFRVQIPESNCILHGRIDAVVPYNDGVEIHDYKTNINTTDDDKAKSKVRSSNQLTMYAVAWRLLHGEKPESVALDFVLTGKIGRMKKQDKSLDTMEAKLAAIAERIKAFDFPLGLQHDYCIHPKDI